MRGRACWAAVFIVVLIHCASQPKLRPDPTPEKPWVACIADAPFPILRAKSPTGNRYLPEIVKIIGYTPLEDGNRFKVLPRNERDPEKWLPFAQEKIQFPPHCGPEQSAYVSLVEGPHASASADRP